ncbi:DUF2510 domain-containing protein [Nocardia gipuzkoensis]
MPTIGVYYASPYPDVVAVPDVPDSPLHPYPPDRPGSTPVGPNAALRWPSERWCALTSSKQRLRQGGLPHHRTGPDPEDEGLLRYWNGTDWTGDRKPVSAVDITGRIQQGIAQAPKVPLFGTRAYAKRQSQELADAHVVSMLGTTWPASVHLGAPPPGLSTCSGFDAGQPSNSPHHHLALEQFDLTGLG